MASTAPWRSAVLLVTVPGGTLTGPEWLELGVGEAFGSAFWWCRPCPRWWVAGVLSSEAQAASAMRRLQSTRSVRIIFDGGISARRGPRTPEHPPEASGNPSRGCWWKIFHKHRPAYGDCFSVMESLQGSFNVGRAGESLGSGRPLHNRRWNRLVAVSRK